MNIRTASINIHFDPLLPDPLVDMQARRDFTQCVRAFDQTGHEIWRKLLPSMSL